MTELRPGSSVTRRVQVQIKDGSKSRQLVVTMHPEYLELRLLGRRSAETVTLDKVYDLAVKGRVLKQRSEKQKARKAKVI